MSKKKIWRPIVGLEDTYEVSNFGEIRNIKTGLLRRLNKDRKGYLYASLWKKNKGKCVKAHRAVADAFIPNPFNKPQVNHIDCNVSNNSVENLEWCTPKENSQHMVKLGNSTKGEKSGNHVLTDDKVREIKILLKKVSQYKIARMYSVSRSTILKIHLNISWKHVL